MIMSNAANLKSCISITRSNLVIEKKYGEADLYFQRKFYGEMLVLKITSAYSMVGFGVLFPPSKTNFHEPSFCLCQIVQ